MRLGCHITIEGPDGIAREVAQAAYISVVRHLRALCSQRELGGKQVSIEVGALSGTDATGERIILPATAVK